MANLSNINNHFIVDTSGKGVFGDVASFSSSGQHGPLNVFKSGAAAAICIDSSGGSGRMYQLRSETNGAFVIYDNPSCDHRMEISSGGEVTFSGNVKVTGAFKDSSGDAGTSGQILSSTATGSNWIDNDTGDVSGSGTTNAVAKFTGAKVIGDGPITFSSNDSTFAGKILVGVGTTAAASINAFSTTVSTGLHSALRIISQPSASNYWDIGATNGASTILNFYHNANTTPKITFTHLGGATFAGTISAVGASTFTLNDGIFIKAVNGTNNVAATNVWGYGLYEGASKLGEISLVRDGSNSQMYIGTTGANQVLRIGSANKVTALTIDASQNVGIGTDSPDGKLEVAGGTTLGLRITNAGDSSAYDQTRITYSGYNSGSPEMVFMPLTTPGSGVLNTFFRFRNTNGSSTTSNNVANVSIDGELGIGTDSPVQPLHVNGQVLFRTTTADGGKNRFQLIPGGSSDAANLYLYYGNSGDGTLSVRINAQGDSYFNGGNVGIGTTLPAYKLEVAGTIGTEDRLAIQQTNFGYSSTYKVVQYGETGSTKAISIGYNPSSNTNSSFSGNEILIPNNIRILAPNAADNQFYGVMMFNSSDKLLIGSSNYLIDSNFIMCLDPATKNVGIGTTSPAQKLHIVDSSTSYVLAETTGTGTSAGFRMKGDASADYTLFTTQGTNQFAIYDNAAGAERMRITSAGDINILNATATDSKSIGITNAAGTTGWTFGNGVLSNTHQFVIYDNTAGSPRMLIDSSGAVGIGTTTPQFSLEVDGAASALNAHFGQGQNNGSGVFGGISLGYAEANTSYRKVGIVAQAKGDGAARQDLHFLVDTVADSGSAGIADSKMSIQYNTGDVIINNKLGIGTTSPVCGLDVRIISGAQFYNESATESNSNIRCRHEGAETSSDRATQISFRDDDDNEVGSIKSSGSATFYNTSSDYRLKQNEKDFNGLDLVDNIKVYDFEWKKDGGKDYGVFAHELQEIVPEAVSGEKDGEEMQGVDYSRLVPILLKSIQELKAEIEELKSNKCNCNK